MAALTPNPSRAFVGSGDSARTMAAEGVKMWSAGEVPVWQTRHAPEG